MRAAAERGTTMINNISESALRIATKIDPSGAIHDREASQQKAKDVRDARPVEGSEQSAHTQKQDPRKEEDRAGICWRSVTLYLRNTIKTAIWY
jgi:hypothetical protein